MYVPFAIEGVLLPKPESWASYVRSLPEKEAQNVLETLRLRTDRDEPDFSAAGDGPTLLQWARTKVASFTLMQWAR